MSPTVGSRRGDESLVSSYAPGGFFVMRSPLLPFTELVHWQEGLPPLAPAPGCDAARSYGERRAALSKRLAAAMTRAELREAMIFVSDRLDAKVGAWAIEEPDPHFEHSLVRYWSRSCARETPFGLFAGISLGKIGSVTRLEVQGRENYRRHTRPSLEFSCALLRALAKSSPPNRLRYRTNSSLQRVFGRWRFARHDAEGKSHPIVDVEPTPHLERALARARSGATLDEIAEDLQPLAIERDEGLAFARALVEHHIIVPDWLPAVSGPEPSSAIQRELEGYAELAPTAQVLAAVRERLALLDASPIGEQSDGLRAVAAELRGAGSRVGVTCGAPLVADLIKPAPGLTLDRALVQRLLHAAEVIQRTTLPTPDRQLEEFRDRFQSRFDSRWVPLADVLDGDLGIGFAGYEQCSHDAMLSGLGLGPSTARWRAVDALDDLRLQILTTTLRRNATEFEIDADLLARFPPRSLLGLPESIAVAAQLARSGESYVIVEPYLIAPSGIATLGRFCHAHPALETALRAHADQEQERAGEHLLADVVHWVDGRAANILLRPALRHAEVVYAGKSGAPEACQIPASDLLVGVEGDRVRLYSRRLRKFISVRIGNAHDSRAVENLPIYRFFSALQTDERRTLASAWSWGMLESSPFLPRITHGDVVLSRARWLIRATELSSLSGTREHGWAQVCALRARLGLPRWVSLFKGDTPLVLDLDNVLCAEVFVREARSTQRLALQELLPGPDELALSGPEGSFTSEVVVPFVRVSVPHRAAATIAIDADREAAPHARSFDPGSEWLYVKVYAGRWVLDRLMLQLGAMLSEVPRPAVESWFFLPYADPEPHLRLRVRGQPDRLFSQVLPAIQDTTSTWRATGAVYRLQLDTYEREVERYGGAEGIVLAERVFAIDSDAAVELLRLSGSDVSLRWCLTLVGIDRLLADFGYGIEQRSKIVRYARDAYRRELEATPRNLRAIASEYRSRCARLANLLWPGPDRASTDSKETRAHHVHRKRSDRLAPTIARVCELADAGQLSIEQHSFALDLAHLHAVRMLGQNARAHELVMYDFLLRQYCSRLRARADTQRSPGAR